MGLSNVNKWNRSSASKPDRPLKSIAMLNIKFNGNMKKMKDMGMESQTEFTC